MPQTMYLLLEAFQEKLRLSIAAVIELWDQGKIFTREEVQSCVGQLERELLEVKCVTLSELTPQLLEIVDLSIRAHVKHAKVIGERNFSLICYEISRMVMFPDLSTLNIKNVFSKFARDGVVANLGRLSHLTCLILPSDYYGGSLKTNRIAQSIEQLPNLRQFEYKFKCNDYIILQICFHCQYISYLNVKCSTKVTDVSVNHLVKKKHLTKLDVSSTSISNLGYRELVANLSPLRKLSWGNAIDEVLKAVDDNCLRNMVEFDGIILNSEELIRKCPNLENMVVRNAGSDLMPFARLESLKSLHLIRFNCSSSNIATVLPVIGPRLQTLALDNVFGLDMVDVIEHCVNLKRLVIMNCQFVPGLPKRDVQNQSHFYNLSELIVSNNIHGEWYLQKLNQSSFLKDLRGKGVPVFNDEYFLRIFRKGGFRSLKYLFLYNCGELGENTFNVVYSSCPNLVAIGYLTNWSRLSKNRISDIQQRCRYRNVEVKL